MLHPLFQRVRFLHITRVLKPQKCNWYKVRSIKFFFYKVPPLIGCASCRLERTHKFINNEMK
jgi:hypothetical protein